MERPHHKLLVGTVNCVCKRWQLAFRWGIETGWRCVYMCVSLCERDTVVSEREREIVCRTFTPYYWWHLFSLQPPTEGALVDCLHWNCFLRRSCLIIRSLHRLVSRVGNLKAPHDSFQRVTLQCILKHRLFEIYKPLFSHFVTFLGTFFFKDDPVLK